MYIRKQEFFRIKIALTAITAFIINLPLGAQNISFDAADPQPDLIQVYGGSFGSGDIDQDGDIDFIMTGLNPARETALYLNDGMGNFTEVENTPFPNASASVTIFNDLDGDQDLDLFFTGIGLGIGEFAHIYLNDGSGTFTQLANPALPGFGEPGANLADVDNDGDTDILIIGVDGDGSFVADIFLNNGQAVFSPANQTGIIPLQLAATAFADVENDGDQDLIVSGEQENGISAVFLYLNDGQGNFSLSQNSGFEPFNANDVDASDVDNDGDMDVLMSGSTDMFEIRTMLYLNNGSGQFSELENTGIQNTFAGTNAFGDLDNDGDQDIVVLGSQAGGIPNIYNIVYENQGNNLYIPVDTIGGEYIAACLIADLNGDALRDIIVQGFVDDTNLYWNSGAIVLNAEEMASTKLEIYPNPTSGILTFYSDQSMVAGSLHILSSQGQVVYELNDISHLNHTIQVDLPSGAYFCRLSTHNRVFTRKILIIK